jgi:hypothetical protein
MPESAVWDWEARTGVGSVREVHRHTVTGLVREVHWHMTGSMDNMPWIS